MCSMALVSLRLVGFELRKSRASGRGPGEPSIASWPSRIHKNAFSLRKLPSALLEALSCEELQGLRGEVVMRPLCHLRRLCPEASHASGAAICVEASGVPTPYSVPVLRSPIPNL